MIAALMRTLAGSKAGWQTVRGAAKMRPVAASMTAGRGSFLLPGPQRFPMNAFTEMGRTYRGLRAGVRPAMNTAMSKMRGPLSFGGALDFAAKGAYTMAFAPLAMIGYPAMKLAGTTLGLGWRATRGMASMSARMYGGSPRGTHMAMALGMGLVGTGIAGRASMGRIAQEKRRDPANTMGLSQSMHRIYGAVA